MRCPGAETHLGRESEKPKQEPAGGGTATGPIAAPNQGEEPGEKRQHA